MKKLLPNLKHKRVLMLGCGTGEESALLEEFGADKMVGMDLSAESVRLAAASYPKHAFLAGDMHALDFPNAEYDFVYSSLTIHYTKNPLAVYKEIFRILKPGGTLQFSIGHPMRWASERVNIGGVPTKLLGYAEGKTGPRLYGSYSNFALYDETFKTGEVLEYWIGPPSLHFGLLKEVGFSVEQFVETQAIEECKEVDPYYYERFSQFPQFIVFVASKPL